MVVQLTKPILKGDMSVEEAIKARRTVRRYNPKGITPRQLSNLCWAGQGVTGANGIYRAAPSAGALYPIFLHVAVGPKSVEGVDEGCYLYHPANHSLELVKKGDIRRKLADAALQQMWLSHAEIMFLIASDFKKITPKYGRRGVKYAHYEAGMVAENILTQAVALGLGAGTVGAFDDERVAKEAALKEEMDPMLLLSVGNALKKDE